MIFGCGSPLVDINRELNKMFRIHFLVTCFFISLKPGQYQKVAPMEGEGFRWLRS